jgi:hypothetical protein
VLRRTVGAGYVSTSSGMPPRVQRHLGCLVELPLDDRDEGADGGGEGSLVPGDEREGVVQGLGERHGVKRPRVTPPEGRPRDDRVAETA